MEPSAVNVDDITISNGYVMYEDEPLVLKTDWMSCFYDDKFGSAINCPITRDQPLGSIMRKIDTIVGESLPAKMKQILLLKKYVDKEGVKHYSLKPKIAYTNVFNGDKTAITTADISGFQPLECRMIFSFPKVKKYKQYYGVVLACKQMQVRKKQRDIAPCLFD